MRLNFVSRNLAWFGGTLAAIGLGFVLAFLIGGPSSDPVAADSPAAGFPVGSSALRVAIDPETGGLVPDHGPVKSLDADLQNMLSRSTAGLKEVVHPDGHVSVHLQGRFMSASVARLDENSQVETTCVENAPALESFLRGEDPSHQVAEPEVK